MIEPNLQEIVERLNKVEKQNRYMKLAGIVFLSLTAMSLLVGAAKKSEVTKEIKAQRIVIVDSEGRERIVMEHGGGWSVFNMLNSKGVITFRTIVTDQSASMTFSAKPGENGLTLWAGEQGSEFKMYGKNNVERISCETNMATSRFLMYSPNIKTRMNITADDLGSSILACGLEKRMVSIWGGDENANSGEIRITNKTGEHVVHLTADEYGNGLVGAYNRKGMGRTLKPGP